MNYFALLLLLAGAPAVAEVLVPVRTIRAKEIITAQDVIVKNADVPGALGRMADVVGMEARVSLYAGRPVYGKDIGPPALISRNEIVPLIFSSGGLHIVTEGRALDRAAAGESLRVMNLSSRSTVTGYVMSDGTIEVR
ncbi:flagellar basal body P-ring formation protein FlgA [Sulfitobacter sp. BDSS02]|nr:flagellar basal body P-ring formation protein FlgA [Sulfitobacter sp. BDSS02]MBR9851272.1 flagellar basal body P-ring formation protein FlgA [Paracoccaceae bacterium]